MLFLRVFIGRLDYLPLFYFGPKFCPLKIYSYFWEINGKWLIIQGVNKLFIVQHPTNFWQFVRDPAAKLMPHSQISLKNW